MNDDARSVAGLRFSPAGHFRDDTCFGRWEQCVEHPRLFRITTRRRSDRSTHCEWTVDGIAVADLDQALAVVADAGHRRAAE